MGLLSSKEKKIKHARILMMGLDAAGKSTFLYMLKFKESVATVPTIGFNVEMIEMDKKFTLTVWDVGGQQEMRTYWKHYFENTEGLVFVVDSADTARLEESKKELNHILKNDHLKKVPVVLLANKQDLRLKKKKKVLLIHKNVFAMNCFFFFPAMLLYFIY
ncbi:UNVERIFIED_CONTAM: hypothetical protein FKN15_049086 [Acipenser sinensis]